MAKSVLRGTDFGGLAARVLVELSLGGAVDVGAQSGKRNVDRQHPLGHVVKQFVSMVGPGYTPWPKQAAPGVKLRGNGVPRS